MSKIKGELKTSMTMQTKERHNNITQNRIQTKASNAGGWGHIFSYLFINIY